MKTIRWFFAFAVFHCCSVPLLRAQLVYQHDQSGNLTNHFSSATTPLSTSASNATQTFVVSNQLALTVMGRGSGPLIYQWRLNGSSIADATNATYFKASTSATDAGGYSVVVTGANGSLTNQLGDITVLASPDTLYGISYGLGLYVAVGEKGAVVLSPDLISWTKVTSGTNNQLNSIAFGNNTFVAVGTNSTIVTSTNGTNWVIRDSGNTNHFKGAIFANSLFVVVGTSGTTMTSPDGVAWTSHTFDYPSLEAITHGNGRFIAVGTSGTIWTSTNGTNWLNRSWTTNLTLNGVVYGNGKFIAVGSGGLILSSTDSTNWVKQTSGTGAAFESVLSFTNTYFAIGPAGKNFLSSNGTNWEPADSGTLENLLGSVVGNSVPVAVGKRGMIIRIPISLIDHFEWALISSPQRVNQSFATTVTAKDAANNTVTSFNGSIALSAVSSQNRSTNTILGNVSHSYSDPGTNTSGYVFTPNADLVVTHVRHYVGKKISIWTDGVELLASVNVTSTPGTWMETPLPAPLILSAGRSYTVGIYSETGLYYRIDGPRTFSNGTIDQGLFGGGDAFPTTPYAIFWFLVDLKYTVQTNQTVSASPTTAGFVNGVANPNVSLATTGEGIMLVATDTLGHVGTSNPFHVYGSNDLAITLSASPNPAAVQNNFTYTVTVLNSGTPSATSVNVTNILPPNVTYVSATPSQGSCQAGGGQVTCSLGSLGNQASATVSIVVTPTVAGILLTNTVTVSRSEAESNLANNSATFVSYVPPTLTVSDVVISEGNVETKVASFLMTLSSASALSVSFDANTANNSATAGSDYVALHGRLIIPPGATLVSLPIQIQGDTVIESDETFFLNLSMVTNATLAITQATCTITNDDGFGGRVHRFVWNTVASPQRTNQPFGVTITARDAANNTATTFNSSVMLRGVNIGGAVTNTVLTNDIHHASANLGLFTLGYEFTPTTNIFVTHMRHYSGTKVSVWTSSGFLLASNNVQSVPGEWTETELSTPLYLAAGSHYRVGVYTGGEGYYWVTDGATTFTNGTITQSYYSVGDTFPSIQDSVRWYMVDLRHTLPASIAPTNSGSFVSGVWSSNLSVQELGTNFTLLADDGDGHVGFANRFGVYQTNDLAVTLTNSPQTVLVNTSLTYTVRVLNAGPSSSTGIFLTNTLPVDITNVTFTSSQGSCSLTNGIVTCDLGTLGNLSSATVTITVTPLVAGQPLTNRVQVIRNESDPNPANNEAVSIVTPDVGLSLLLQTASDYSGSAWRSGPSVLWTSQTNYTHDGIDAGQSGPVIHGQQSWISTTVRGPGNVSFWWKVSSQQGFDGLIFYTNSITAVTSISGEADWRQTNFNLGAGVYTLYWLYIKDASISSGSDAGWVDQINYTVPAFYLSSPSYSNGLFRVTLNGTNGQRLITQGSSDLIRWSSFTTNTLSSSTLNLLITPPTNVTSRFYRSMHRND